MLLTLAYLVSAGAYVVLSSRFAARAADTVGHLEQIEVAKGVLFVLVTGSVFFGLAWSLLGKMALLQNEQAIARDELQKIDRAALASTLARSVGHDINNVLTVATGRLYMRVDDSEDKEHVQVHVEDVQSILDQIGGLAKQLLSLGQEPRKRTFTRVPAEPLISQLLRLATGHPTLRNCNLTYRVQGTMELSVDREQFDALLLNLLLNAGEATKGCGRIHVALSREAKKYQLEVHDDGPGIPEAERDRIFEPFHSTKTTGSGLGLLTVRSFAEAHGGWVDVRRSELLGGACIRVVIP